MVGRQSPAMPLHIANLGSSFAAGTGIPPQVDRWAMRSGSNYAHLLADRLGARLTDLTVSGATLLNILNEPQSQLWFHTFAPQISELPPDADVVLVLGGGNDVDYVLPVMYESVIATYSILRWIVGLARWVIGEKNKQDQLDAEGLAERYGAVLDAIHTRTPKAQVVVVEYVTIFGPDDNAGGIRFEAGRVEHHRAKAALVQRATAKALQGREAWCTRVPVAELSQQHGIGSNEPWIAGLDLGSLWRVSAWHPNARGHAAVAEMIYQVLVNKGLVTEVDGN